MRSESVTKAPETCYTALSQKECEEKVRGETGRAKCSIISKSDTTQDVFHKGPDRRQQAELGRHSLQVAGTRTRDLTGIQENLINICDCA